MERGQNLTERIWSKMGMDKDAYFAVDSLGTEFAGGGLNASLRDMARFGEMMRNQGKFNGQQIIPASVVQDIAKGGDKGAFPQASFPTSRMRAMQPRRSERKTTWKIPAMK